MWIKLSQFILKFRLPLMLVLVAITAFMAYQAQFIKWSFDLANVVPANDSEMVYFKEFKKTFGEDGNILAIGINDSSIYQVENFRRLKYLSEEISKLNGVNSILSLTEFKKLLKNKKEKKFELVPVFETIPETQEELDVLLLKASNIKFYSGQIINPNNGANMILITIDKHILNSKKRDNLIRDILMLSSQFETATQVKLHYAGLPYVRYTTTSKVKKELNFFLLLSVLVTGFIMFLFFRSWRAVIFPLIIIGVIAVWVMGTLALFDFKVTMLTGLIPPIIVVIGIPNSVYMLNKYHQEYVTHGDQRKALGLIISKIGIVTLITNFTTAVGFLVLAFTDIVILKEFGIVAGINIMATFVVSLIMIPSVFSYLSAPSEKHLKHLGFIPLDKILTTLDLLVHRHKYYVFGLSIIIVVISFFGLMKIEAVSFMVDDLPEESIVKQDLYFFEEHFSGVMPLEIVVDTGVKKGVKKLSNLRRIDKFEKYLASLENVSQPISVVSIIKAASQAYFNDNPKKYRLPNNQEKAFILRYLSEDTDNSGISSSFLDSASQKIRISVKIADIGSQKMDSLVNQVIAPKIDEYFGESKLDVTLTGTTLLFIKGNKFLIENLLTSMVIAFVIIAIIIAMLFSNFKMIIISLIPNMVPLLITGGMMGYLGVPLKPSTALIFSIAFGISVDDSIHFLAKYRQELFANNFLVPLAVSKSLRETGASMIYTSIILFFGFIIFAASEFGGTVALGFLTSTTLLIAMITNLTLLPALLLRFDSGKRNVERHPLIETYPEFYHENEDEEIDLDKIEVEKGISN